MFLFARETHEYEFILLVYTYEQKTARDTTQTTITRAHCLRACMCDTQIDFVIYRGKNFKRLSRAFKYPRK